MLKWTGSFFDAGGRWSLLLIKKFNGYNKHDMRHIRKPWKMERHLCLNRNSNLGGAACQWHAFSTDRVGRRDQRTCYIADPEGNLIEIGSWNKPYEEKDLTEG